MIAFCIWNMEALVLLPEIVQSLYCTINITGKLQRLFQGENVGLLLTNNYTILFLQIILVWINSSAAWIKRRFGWLNEDLKALPEFVKSNSERFFKLIRYADLRLFHFALIIMITSHDKVAAFSFKSKDMMQVDDSACGNFKESIVPEYFIIVLNSFIGKNDARTVG